MKVKKVLSKPSKYCVWPLQLENMRALENKYLNNKLLSTVLLVHERKSPLHKTHLYEEIPANDKMSRCSLHKNNYVTMYVVMYT